MLDSLLVELATLNDQAAVRALDTLLSDDGLHEKLLRQEVLVARCDGEVVAVLRWGWFWDEVPFINLLLVTEPHRRHKIGQALVRAWEERMHALGHGWVLTSTLANEPGQHFWRAIGYHDCGALLLPGEATELLLRKDL